MLAIAGQEASAQAPAAPWTRSPSIIVLSPEISPLHLEKTRTAVAFWNRELAALGIGLRLGAITRAEGQMSNSDYTPHPGSIVIVFGGGAAFSHGHSQPNNQGGVIHMRIGDGTILIHELGHALGLPHNFDQPSVMSRAPDGLHLGAADNARLLAMYSARPGRRQTAAR
jgi:hypothetical protein